MFPFRKISSNNLRKTYVKHILLTKQMCYSVKNQSFAVNKISKEEQQKILSIFNDSNIKQLKRLNMTLTEVKSIMDWKNKWGSFESIEAIFKVDFLEEKKIGEVFEEIINDNLGEASNQKKKLKQVLIPQISDAMVNNIESAIGIHLGPTGISWAKFSRLESKVCDWNYELLTTLPNKLTINETYNLATGIASKLPLGDIYIFEANSPLSQVKSANMSSYNQHLELMSMLYVFLNTRSYATKSITEPLSLSEIGNTVYQIKSKVPARLFKTLVGNEKVSAIAAISELINNNHRKITNSCSSIWVETSIRNYYNEQPSVSKELLGQALMIVVSFMDLCVFKNPSTIKAFMSGRSK